jgi:hypothetical protein
MDAMNKGMSIGIPLAATTLTLGSGALVPALARAGASVVGGIGGGAAGRFAGGVAEDAGAPEGTKGVLTFLGGLAGGGVGALKGRAGLEKVGEAITNPLTRGASRGMGREAAEEFTRRRLELEAAKIAQKGEQGARALSIAEQRLLDNVKIAEARLQVSLSKQASSTKIQQDRLMLQKAKNEADKVLDEGRLSESARKTDIGKDVADARTRESVRRGYNQRVQGEERLSQGERRLKITEAKARREGLLEGGTDDPVVTSLMRGDSSFGPMSREAAEELAKAISQKAGRGVPAAAAPASTGTARFAGSPGGPTVTKVKGGNFGEASMEQVKAKVLSWKHKQKFSDDVIVDTMREQFGIPNSQGKQLLQMILAE